MRDPTPGNPPHIILSREGLAQGDSHAMNLYGVGLMPLAEKMRRAVPQALQPWFADDGASAGQARANAACARFLIDNSDPYGYYI